MTPNRLFALVATLATLPACSSSDGPLEFTYVVAVDTLSVDSVSFDGVEREGIVQVFPDYADAIGTVYRLTVSRDGVTATMDLAIETECGGDSVGHPTSESRTLVFDATLGINFVLSGIFCRGTHGTFSNYDDQ